MANNFNDIIALTTGKNSMGLSNTIKRDFGIPLDYSSVQESYDAALNYAKTSTLAYIGQPIAVGDTLYIVTDAAGGYLKPVGTKPTGDNKSITVGEDGVVAMYGFSAAGTATLPQKQADGTIRWVGIDTIVKGDGNTKAVVEAADGSDITVTPVYDSTNDTYTYTLDVKFPAIPAYTIVKETGTGKTTYKLTKDGTQVGAAIEVADAYDDTALTQRVADVEADVTRIEAVETKVNEFFAAVENPDEVVNTLAEIQKYIADDKTGAAGMLEDIAENAAEIEKLKGTGDGSVKKAIEAAIATKDAADTAKYATKDALAEVSAVADAAAVKTEVEEALEDKVDTTTLTSNYYNKTEVYTKEQVDTAIGRITGTNGTSLPELTTRIENHETASAGRFAEIEAKNGTQDTTINANTQAIAAINNETTGIYARAKADAVSAAQGLVNDLANGAVKTNTTDIAALKSKVEAAEGTITTLSGTVGTLEGTVGTLNSGLAAEKGAREALGETVGTHTTDIEGLKTAQTQLRASVTANTDKFKDYSTTTDVAEMIRNAIADIDHTAITNAIAANTKAISDETTRAKAREDEIAALVNKNSEGLKTANSNISQLETAINAVINNEDGTALNSIKELATWVTEHESEVLPTITANKNAIDKLNGTGEGSVAKTVADAIAKIPATPIATSSVAGVVKASAEVSVAADGTMSVGYISTDKLTQGTEPLVLNGGSASTSK